MKKFTLAMIAATALTTMSAANAYTTKTCNGNLIKWDSNNITLYAHTDSFPANSAERSALITAVSRLNANPSHFKFSLVYTSQAPALGNGRSEVWFAVTDYPGVTYGWNENDCSSFAEKDIVMNPNVTWTTSTLKTTMSEYGGSGRPLQTTILHELGHGLGLGHEADEYNIMGQDWDHVSTNGEYAHSYFGEDAGDGSVYLYGNDGTQDLGIVHYRYSHAGGAYSAHKRTILKDPATNSELPYSWVNGEKRYNVVRGQNVRMELTYENNGNNYKYEDVGYYFSGNSYISEYDTLLATRNIGLSPDMVYTSTYDVTIPSNASCNTPAWVGAKIDANKTLTEYHEFNNATTIPVYVGWSFSCLVLTQPVITL